MKYQILTLVLALSATTALADVIGCDEFHTLNNEVRVQQDDIGRQQGLINATTAQRDVQQTELNLIADHLKTIDGNIAFLTTQIADLEAIIKTKSALDADLASDIESKNELAEVIETELDASKDAPRFDQMIVNVSQSNMPANTKKTATAYLKGFRAIGSEPSEDAVKTTRDYLNIALDELRTPLSQNVRKNSDYLSSELERIRRSHEEERKSQAHDREPIQGQFNQASSLLAASMAALAKENTDMAWHVNVLNSSSARLQGQSCGRERPPLSDLGGSGRY
jgi:hypothetical protein